MHKLALCLVGIAALGWAGTAQAACYDFDSCFFEQLGQMQQNNNAAIQQNYANYMQVYGPQLQQAYQEWGYQTGATFDQFAYYMLMSANGTDPKAALEVQRQQFAGNQAAHNTQLQTGETYLDTMQQNSDRALDAVENYDLGAVRGNIIVNGPTGPVELPYSGMQTGQQVTSGGYTYMMTEQGYAIWTGNGWYLLQ